MTFARYAEMWRAAQHVRPGTANLHEQRVRLYLNPVLGTVPLRAIRRSHVVEVVRRCSHDLGLSPLVTRYAVTTLRAILTAAVADRLIPNNVAIDRTIQMPRPQRATGTLSAEHVAAIAARMEGRYRAMVTLGAASGLRPGELTGLTIDRCAGLAAALTDGGVIDLAARRAGEAPDTRLVTLKVDRQINSGKRQFGPPKTPSSVRDVTVGATVVAALVHHVRTYGLGDHGLLFTNPMGKVLGSPHLSKAWARATAGLALPPGATWHDLRHHHASSLLSAGINIAAVAARLGHSSPTVTLEHYAWALPADEQRVLDASEAIARRLA